MPRRRIVLLAACIAASQLLATGAAPDPPSLPIAAAQAAQPATLAPFGDRVLLGQGARLAVLQVDDDGVREIGALDALPGLIQDVAVREGRAYVALRSAEYDSVGGVATVDLAEPAQPQLLGTVSLGPIRALAVSEAGLLYAAGPGKDSPYRTGPPGVLRALRPHPTGLETVHERVLDAGFADIIVRGNRLYALEERFGDWAEMATIRTVDITDPALPTLGQVLPLHFGAERLEATASELLVAADERGLLRVPIAEGPRAELGEPQRFDPPGCIGASASRGNLSALINPCVRSVTFVTRGRRTSPLRTVALRGRPADALWIGDRLLVAMEDPGEWALLHPEDGTTRLAAQQAPRATRIFLPYALAETAPADAGRLLRRATLAGAVRALAASERHVYASEGQDLVVLSAATEGLRPRLRLPNQGAEIHDLQLVGDRLYAAAGPAGLLVWAIDSSGKPSPVGHGLTGDWAVDVEVVDGVAFVAALDAGLQAFDVTAAEPRLIESLPLPGRASRILRQDTTLYVSAADWWDPAAIVDIRDVRNARLEGPLESDEAVDAVSRVYAALDDRLYAAGCGNCLDIFDITRSLTPRHIGSWSDFGWGDALATLVDASRAQVWFGSTHGLSILDLAQPTFPTLVIEEDTELRPGAFARQGPHALAGHAVDHGHIGDSSDPSGLFLASDGVSAIRLDACCASVAEYRPPLSRMRLIPSGSEGPPRYVQRVPFEEIPGALSAARLAQSAERETFLLDLSDPLRPALGARVPALLEPNLQVRGERGYQLHRPSPTAPLELQILSLADPARPRILGSHPASLYATFALVGEHVGILTRWTPAGNSNTIEWLDLAQPSRVQVLAETTFEQRVSSVHTIADRAWITTHGRFEPTTLHALRFSHEQGVEHLGEHALPRNVGTVITIDDPTGSAELLYVSTNDALYVAELSPAGAVTRIQPILGRAFTDLIAIDAKRWLGIGDGTVLLHTSDPRRPFVLDELDRGGQPLGAEAAHATIAGSWIYLGMSALSPGHLPPDYTEVVELR